jgi:hypothetical protein
MLRVPDARSIKRWEDAQLADLMERHCKRARVFEMVMTEFDRRAVAERTAARRRAKAAELRGGYDLMVEAQFRAAEGACNGYLVNKAGRAAGIDPVSLFSGPWARARKYASEELVNFWLTGRHPRMSFAEYRRQAREGRPE